MAHHHAQGLDAPLNRAFHLAEVEALTGDAGRFALRPGVYYGATPAAIRRVAEAYLGPERRFVAEVVPTKGAPKGGRVVGRRP